MNEPVNLQTEHDLHWHFTLPCSESNRVVVLTHWRLVPSILPYILWQGSRWEIHVMAKSNRLQLVKEAWWSPMVQSTLPRSNLNKSNNHPSQRSILSPLFSISIVLDPTQAKFSQSRSYFFSPNGFDLGRVDCMFFFSPYLLDKVVLAILVRGTLPAIGESPRRPVGAGRYPMGGLIVMAVQVHRLKRFKIWINFWMVLIETMIIN